MKHLPLFALTVFTLATNVHAQTLSLSSGDIAVSGGTISAGNRGCGLYAIHTGSVTITGGSIKAGSEGYGMYAVLRRGSIIITGGSIKAGNNGIGLITYGTSPFTITGGSISIGSARKGLVDYGALVAYGGPVTIRGGSISAGAGGFELVAEPGGSIDLYGKFYGLTLGETKNLPRGKGSFVGRSCIYKYAISFTSNAQVVGRLPAYVWKKLTGGHLSVGAVSSPPPLLKRIS